MATYQKRGKRWRAIVRTRGVTESRTFSSKGEAQRWAIGREDAIARGDLYGKGLVRDAFKRYREDICLGRKGGARDAKRLESIEQYPLADVKLAELRPRDIAEWRDQRLNEVAPSSVNRELNIISAALTRCVKEWHWLPTNPCHKLDRPPNPQPRNRRISPEEQRIIIKALESGGERMQQLSVMFQIALETAMRLGEITSLRGEHIHSKWLEVVQSKNGDRRSVPLSSRARELLRDAPQTGPVFHSNSNALSALFSKVIRTKTDLRGLCFHDTRHEALTQLARRLDVLDLARMVGHRDPRSLLIYFNPTPDEIADRLG